jgi:two-component system NarL family response regulator
MGSCPSSDGVGGDKEEVTLIEVVVVDNEAPFARAIAGSLAMEEDIEVVGIGYNGLEALDLVRRFLPDVVLLDLEMPVMGGLQALREIKQQTPSTGVLVLTHHEEDANVFTALQAGAKGYLLKATGLKATGLDEIACGIRTVAAGGAVIPPVLAPRVLEEFQRMASQPPACRDLFSVLTRREVEVLRRMALNQKNQEIADALDRDVTTIKKHITNIRQKLEVNSRTEAILIAYQGGLVP